MAKKKQTSKLFPDVIPNINDWPIAKLSRNKKTVLDEVVQKTMERILEMTQDGDSLEEEIADALYHEKNRIKLRPWPVDPKDEQEYWNTVQSRLVDIGTNKETNSNHKAEILELLEEIVSRYANEIVAKFRTGYYEFAKRLVPHGFASLLNKKQISLPVRFGKRRMHLDEKIHLAGHIEQVRKLITKGTVVLAPTHFSNLDSVLMGWGIQSVGLPAFHYGAGLNLFNTRLFAFFMDRLGAYKVDRRKKNRIYLETLKIYSTITMKQGVHALFFPGGTRSRNGAIQDKLKLGLLSTTIDAQRMIYLENLEKENKIYIVPVAINYHFVLEAPTLIDDYLKASGREKYYFDKDELSTSFKIIKALLKILTVSSEIGLSFGKPMDVFGHEVDDEGISHDSYGNEVNIRGYFETNGIIQRDIQRESEYARLLSSNIASQFLKINLVMSSHLVAFTAFEIILKDNRKLDLYDLLRLPASDIKIEYDYFVERTEHLRNVLLEWKEEGKLDIAPHINLPIVDLIRHGLYNVGLYHARKTLRRDKSGNIVTDDIKTLYYYHNRLMGYGLENEI